MFYALWSRNLDFLMEPASFTLTKAENNLVINVYCLNLEAGTYESSYTFYVPCYLRYRSANYASIVAVQLIMVASHMAGLGLPDTDAWFMIETIAEKNNIGYKQFVSYISFGGWVTFEF
ncbi:denn domain and wd repeat-containing protein scd1 [Quercus suber]|uniref:Denn domain and wd repeat-containing protein scd1 n=1 Tax=Quercus suber TaxID=58331 RepID=A0AAW0K5W4_QUESU